MSSTSAYQETPALKFARERITNAKRTYEWHIASWATTIISQHFHGNSWILTPEMYIPGTVKGKRKPDFVVEKVVDNDGYFWPAFVFKQAKGDRFEKALAQIADTIHFAVQEMGDQYLGDRYEAYIVVVVGTNIGFFEYHKNTCNLDEE